MSKNYINDFSDINGGTTRRSGDSIVAEKNKTNTNKKLETKASMDINESADLFIKKFRQQLLIQRLDSIENYKQMLARGL